MNKERLLRLAARMRKVDPGHFNIRTWYSVAGIQSAKRIELNLTPWDEAPPPTFAKLAEKRVGNERRKVLLKEGFCGSVACVLGHAALIEEFNDEGLYVDVTEVAGGAEILLSRPGRPTLKGSAAGAKFFDIHRYHANVMFGTGGRYEEFYGVPIYEKDLITPLHVAEAIEKYVATDGASIEPYIPDYQW